MKHARLAFFLAVLTLCGVLDACLPDADFKHRNTTVPERLDDGWEIDTPENVGLDPALLSDMHDQLLREDRSFGTLSVAVIKDGKLVWETYLRSPADRDHVHHLQSSTKSITSLALGLARDAGHLLDLSATLPELFPDRADSLDPRKATITLEHLLTMRSGIAFDNDDFSVEMWVDKPADPLGYILDKPMYATPGERFYYRDADPQLVGYALQDAVGMNEAAWVQQGLFDPLGITDVWWEAGHDGVSLAAHGLHLRPRDFAKIGLFLLNGCRWHDVQLVPTEWCMLATQEQVAPDQTENDSRREPLGYGYYFWTLPDDHGAYATWGHGGQYLLIVPEENMVLVQTGLPDTSDDLNGGNLADFVELTAPLWR